MARRLQGRPRDTLRSSSLTEPHPLDSLSTDSILLLKALLASTADMPLLRRNSTIKVDIRLQWRQASILLQLPLDILHHNLRLKASIHLQGLLKRAMLHLNNKDMLLLLKIMAISLLLLKRTTMLRKM